MSELNFDDMDDLFKKAGEQYPLRTDNADWDMVSGLLDESNPAIFALPADAKKNSGKRKYLMLAAFFVLLLTAYFGMYRSVPGPASGSQKLLSSHKKSKENTPGNVSGNGSVDTILRATAGNGSGVFDGSAALKVDRNNIHPNMTADIRETDRSESGMKEIRSPLQPDKSKLVSMGEIDAQQVFDITKNKPATQASFLPEKSISPAASPKHSKFYGGIIIAPDISMVKFQSVKGVGFSAGFLAGYKISKKISIETGAQLDIKDYYSEGEYFNKENIPNLDYSDLINIKGNCKMIEVPVNLRYNFHQSLKNDWFITTGFSTYFMFRESYDYNYLHYGMQKSGNYATAKPSQYWFSVVNISIGYEHQVGKTGSIRIEPYLKSPLTGMGTGNLPIMSTGINLGIIHRF